MIHLPPLFSWKYRRFVRSRHSVDVELRKRSPPAPARADAPSSPCRGATIDTARPAIMPSRLSGARRGGRASEGETPAKDKSTHEPSEASSRCHSETPTLPVLFASIPCSDKRHGHFDAIFTCNKRERRPDDAILYTLLYCITMVSTRKQTYNSRQAVVRSLSLNIYDAILSYAQA